MIITIAGQMREGKTAVARILAATLKEHGFRVSITDADTAQGFLDGGQIDQEYERRKLTSLGEKGAEAMIITAVTPYRPHTPGIHINTGAG